MKVTYRIPTNEPYSYLEIEQEIDHEAENILEAIKTNYDNFTQAVRERPAGIGLERLVWNRVLDRYVKERTMLAEEYEGMDAAQQGIIQELKKSFARTK